MPTGSLSLLLVTAIAVSLLKVFLELWVPPRNALHDTVIRLVSIAVGLVAAFADYGVHTTAWTGVAVEATAGRGLEAGVGAVLLYHLLTSSVFDVLTPSAPAPLQPATLQTVEVVTPVAPQPATAVSSLPSVVEQVAQDGPAFPPAV